MAKRAYRYRAAVAEPPAGTGGVVDAVTGATSASFTAPPMRRRVMRRSVSSVRICPSRAVMIRESLGFRSSERRTLRKVIWEGSTASDIIGEAREGGVEDPRR